ncbi:MAG: hypothetical protein AB1425_00860, partial [Actinomycetota bacterium]
VLEILKEPEQLVAREQHWIDALSAYSKGYNLTPRAGSNLGRTFGAAARANMAKAARLAMGDPDIKQRHKAAVRAAMAHPKTKRRTSEAARKRWTDPQYRAKMAEVRRSTPYREARAAAARAKQDTPGEVLRRAELRLKVKASRSTPESRQKSSQASKAARAREWGTLTPDERRAKCAEMEEKSAKTYTAIAPSGETFLVRNLKRFCREQGIPYSSARNVLAGRGKTARGWRFAKAKETSRS